MAASSSYSCYPKAWDFSSSSTTTITSRRLVLHSFCRPPLLGRVVASSRRIQLTNHQDINWSWSVPPWGSSSILLKNGARRFESACSYSSSTASPQKLPPSPFMTLPPKVERATGDKVYRFFNPADKKIVTLKKKKKKKEEGKGSLLPNNARCFGSSHGWLFLVDPLDSTLYMWNPYSTSTSDEVDVIRLPPIETLPYFSKSDDDDDDDDDEEYSMTNPALSAPPTNKDCCTLMAIEGITESLSYCKPGDTTWTDLDGPLCPYAEISYSNKDQLFYAMGIWGGVEAWDLRDHSSPKRISIDKDPHFYGPKFKRTEEMLRLRCKRERYLVASSGDILILQKYAAHHFAQANSELSAIVQDGENIDNLLPYKTLRFDVYKLDPAQGVWTYLECLGDRALFVGLNHPFSLSTRDFPELKPNSIYFTGSEYDGVTRKGYRCGGHDLGVFNLEDNRVEPYIPLGRTLKKIEPPPVWVCPLSVW